MVLRPGAGGKLSHLVLARTEQDDDGTWKTDGEQTMKLRCDYVVSAFGSGLYSEDIKKALEPMRLNKWGAPEVNSNDMSTRCPQNSNHLVG